MAIRSWVKILPYWVVERICLKFCGHYAYLDKTQVRCWMMSDGVWLCKDVKHELKNKKHRLEMELEEINDALGEEGEDGN